MGAAKKLYVKKDQLVSIEEAKSNMTIHTPEGYSVPVAVGELVATNPKGEQYVVPKSYRNKYVEVKQFKDASLYESMAKGYQEMAAINLEEASTGFSAENQAEEKNKGKTSVEGCAEDVHSQKGRHAMGHCRQILREQHPMAQNLERQ